MIEEETDGQIKPKTTFESKQERSILMRMFEPVLLSWFCQRGAPPPMCPLFLFLKDQKLLEEEVKYLMLGGWRGMCDDTA